jgi:hypothetical protein
MFGQVQLDSPELARVTGAQRLLFARSPRSVCEEMGLNWWTAVKLHEEGWLSFPPQGTARLDEQQEAELHFVGSLALRGCDSKLLPALLSGLQKPYAYDLRRLYYDWSSGQWRSLPDPHSHPEMMFTDWLDKLIEQRDIDTLTGIEGLTRDALWRVRTAPLPSEPQLRLSEPV